MKRRTRQRTELSTYLASRTALFAIVPTVIAFAASLVFLNFFVEGSLTRELEFTADRLAASIESELDSFTVVLSTAAAHLDAGLGMGETEPVGLSRAEYFSTLQMTNPEIVSIWLLDSENGTLLDAFPPTPELIGMDLSGTNAYVPDSREPVWSDIGINPVLEGSSLSLTIPAARYMLVAWFEPAALVRLVQVTTGPDEIYAFAADRHGLLIAHPDVSRVIRRLSVGSNPVVQAALGGERATGHVEGEVVSANRLLPQGWIVAVARSRRATTELIAWLVVIGSAGFVASGLATLIAARRAAQLLGEGFLGLIDSAQQIAGGSYGVIVPDQRFRDLSFLAGAIRKMVRTILERENALGTVVANADVLLFATGIDEKIVVMEGRSLAKLGRTPQELVGRPISDLFGPREEFKDAVRRTLSGEALDYTIEVDGLTFQSHHSPVVDKSGTVTGLIGVATDVTRQVALTRELTALNEHLEAEVASRTQELSNALDNLRRSQERLIDAEKLSALGHFAAGIAHELNTPLGVVLSSAESVRGIAASTFVEVVRQARAMPDEVAAEFLSLLHEIVSLPPPVDPLQPTRALRRRLREELEQLRCPASRSVATLLVEVEYSGRLDRYRNLLSSPDAESTIGAIHAAATLKQSADLMTIAGERAAGIVRALRSYISPQAAEQFLVFDIEAELESLLTIMHNKLKRGVSVSRDFAGVTAFGSAQELNQVWMNLIRNAAEAIDYSGAITLRTRRENGWVSIEVIDDGPGIPEEHRERVFEPFFTTKERGKGMGIGLDITRQIVKRHGGRIELESEPGHTCVTVILPDPR